MLNDIYDALQNIDEALSPLRGNLPPNNTKELSDNLMKILSSIQVKYKHGEQNITLMCLDEINTNFVEWRNEIVQVLKTYILS